MELINILAENMCDSHSIRRVIAMLGNLFNIIKIAAPIILIIYGTIDLVKAMMASDDSQMKKAQQTFIKRTIIAVCIFFVFPVVTFLMGLVGQNMEDNQACMNCLLYPNDKTKCFYTIKQSNSSNNTNETIQNQEINIDQIEEAKESGTLENLSDVAEQ